MSEEEPKIIIDEDWKAQVEREKEQARQAVDTGKTEPDEEAAMEPEAANFEALVSGLAMQAMIALGVMVPRDVKEVVVDLPGAKYAIDLLMMLREKTKNNLTPKEQGFLAENLAELQRAYVLRSQQLQEAALRGTNINPAKKP